MRRLTNPTHPPSILTEDNRIKQFWAWVQVATLRFLESDFMQNITRRLSIL